MDSFLIIASKAGHAEQIFWSDPEELLAGRGRSVPEWFSGEDRAALREAFRRGAAEEFACAPQLRLADRPSGFTVCVAPMDKKYLVFAAEGRLDAHGVDFPGLARLFMLACRDIMQKNAIIQTAFTSVRTDMIKTLTTELRNRKRELEAANEKMNSVNEDLNSRLVKDPLTGLVSRYQYREEMERVIRKHPGRPGVFVFMDVDDFKLVNDRFGHAAGDEYLAEFAERLRRLGFPDMIAMRISGDEFGLFIHNLDDAGPAAMQGIWSRFRETVLARPIAARGRALPVSVSAGMAAYGIDTQEIYELIEFADFAMYRAKRTGKNGYCAFDKSDYGRLKKQPV